MSEPASSPFVSFSCFFFLLPFFLFIIIPRHYSTFVRRRASLTNVDTRTRAAYLTGAAGRSTNTSVILCARADVKKCNERRNRGGEKKKKEKRNGRRPLGRLESAMKFGDRANPEAKKQEASMSRLFRFKNAMPRSLLRTQRQAGSADKSSVE